MEKKKSIPAFLRSTYAMLEREQLSGIVAWGQGGQGFVIKDLARFSAEILPQYFKHQKYTSFVRQLNMYGFHKQRAHDYPLPLPQAHQYFAHEHFRRGDAQTRQQGARMLLAAIRRKPEKKKKNSNAPSQTDQNQPHPSQQEQGELQSCSSARSVSLEVQEQGRGGSQECGGQEEWESEGSWEGVDAVTEQVMAQNQLLRDLHTLIRQEVLSAKKRSIARLTHPHPQHAEIDQEENASITRLTELLLETIQTEAITE